MVKAGKKPAEAYLHLGDSDSCAPQQECLYTDGADGHIGIHAGWFHGNSGCPSGCGGAGCWIYLFEDASGWHFVNAACAQAPGETPGAEDLVRVSGGGCANVRSDPGNTSYNPNETVISPATVNTLAEAWSLKIGFTSSPVVVNGVIYSPCQFTIRPIVPEMCAIDAVKGTLIWHSGQLGNTMDVTTAAVDNGRVFVGIQEPASMVALDAATGQILWGHGVPYGYQINDGPTVANGTVFFTPDDGNLWALDEATGATKWTAPSGNFGGTPAYANGVVYVDG